MAYRDDELNQIKNQVNSVEERLNKLENLNKEKPIRKRRFPSFPSFSFMTSSTTWIIFVTLLVFGGMSFGIYKGASQKIAQVEEECADACEKRGYVYYGYRSGVDCYCGAENSDESVISVNLSANSTFHLRSERNARNEN